MFHGLIFPLEYRDNNTLESGRKPYLEKASAIWMQSDDIIPAPLVVLGAVLSSCMLTPPSPYSSSLSQNSPCLPFAYGSKQTKTTPPPTPS